MKQRFFFVLIIVLMGSFACQNTQKPAETDGDKEAQTETVDSGDFLTTSDNFKIAYDYIDAGANTPAVILVHQLGSNKESWAGLQSELQKTLISSLAIDLRGHGESNQNGELDYRHFEEKDWAGSAADIIAGIEFLKSKGHPKIGLVGSSIGANLSVVAAADIFKENPDANIACIVTLSPGVNYRGVQPLPRGHDLDMTPVLIISATADIQSYPGSQALDNAARNSELISIEGDTHGTDILSVSPEIQGKIIEFLSSHLK